MDIQLQFQAGFVDRMIENEVISQRITDGYVNATAMCRAAGKQMNDYMRLKTTTEYLAELSAETGIPVSEIVIISKGGNVKQQGTWIHPQAAINLGQWLSSKFAVAVSKWVFEWLSGGIKGPQLPYHLRRYMANMSNVPYGFFSMLNEVTLVLIGPLEQMGYTLPPNMLPDGSLGKVFSRYLREQGYPVDDYPKYQHDYEDGRVYPARAYPNALIGELRKYFVEVWLKEKSQAYFAEKDPAALPYLNQFLTLPNHRDIMGYIEM